MSFAHVPMIARRALMPMLLAAMVVSVSANDAMAGGNSIIYGGIQPAAKPAWGQTIMVTGRIIRSDRGPVANQVVELWFSGQHGVRAQSVRVKTDRAGNFSAMMTIPRNWRDFRTWVDINISCPSAGVLRLYRVRNR